MSQQDIAAKENAFTLIELLVVIAVIVELKMRTQAPRVAAPMRVLNLS